ncbi:helix-turn-helix domain-containing protein, partial [Vibrio cyclitrophicus]
QHRQDKQALIENIHNKYAENQQAICPHLMSLLCAYSWPGNIRELDNLLKVAALLAGEEAQLTLEHVPSHLAQQLTSLTEDNHHKPMALNTIESTPKSDLKSTVEDTLLQTYQANQGNISKTSRILGISRNTIYRKLKSLGIINKQ